MGKCLFKFTHMIQYAASCLPPLARKNSHASFSSTPVQLCKNPLTRSPGYNNLYVEAVVCVVVSSTLHGEESVGGWVLHHIRHMRWWRGWVWWSGSAQACDLWLQRHPRLGKLSCSDLSAFLVVRLIDREALFIFLGFFAFQSSLLFSKRPTDAWELAKDKDFASLMTAEGSLCLSAVSDKGRLSCRNATDHASHSRSTRLVASRCSPACIGTSPRSVSCTRWSHFLSFFLFLFIHFNSCYLIWAHLPHITDSAPFFDRYTIDSWVNNGGSSSFRQLLINSLWRPALSTAEY